MAVTPGGPVHHWFVAQAECRPDAVALRIGPTAWSYGDLHDIASHWAARIGPARRVGILTGTTLTRYAGVLAALYAGAAFVPLHAGWPAARLRQVIDQGELDVLIVDGTTSEGIGPGAGPRVFGPDDQRAATAVADRRVAADGVDNAYLMFTSGSTGVPKGVPISHANIDAFLRALLPSYPVGPGDTFSQATELVFDVSMFEIFMAWSSGACVRPLSRLQAGNPVRCVDELGVTVWMSTPSLATLVLTADRAPAGSLGGLRHVAFCGEPLSERVAGYWRLAAPNATVDNLYGPTEATVACTMFRMPPGEPMDLSEFGSTTVPIGAPLPGVDCVLLDADGTPTTGTGELCVAGRQVFGGYLAKAADVFLEREGRRWYRTGDLATYRHGQLLHLGRLDTQVKVNGYRIELAEVELAVQRCLPGAMCGVVASTRSADTTGLVCFVAGRAVELAELRRLLADELPVYMLPTELRTVPSLPLNQNGKLDRPRLAALARGECDVDR